MKDQFNVIIPAEIVKSEDGEWKIRGLASTEARDRQGEVILQNGIDLTPIEKGQGYFNFDHLQGPENLIGVIDGYKKDSNGLFVEGRLFKNHEKAKAVYQVMSSLGKSDRGRVGLSVEGSVLERDPGNPKVIRKCRIKNVAVTFSPVNTETYADLLKSLSAADVMEFAADGKTDESQPVAVEQKVFSASEVVELVQKALAVGAGYTQAPTERSGGDALAQESSKPEAKKRKLKKMSPELCKSNMVQILDNIQKLYPEYSRNQLWKALKDRLTKKYPEIKI